MSSFTDAHWKSVEYFPQINIIQYKYKNTHDLLIGLFYLNFAKLFCKTEKPLFNIIRMNTFILPLTIRQLFLAFSVIFPPRTIQE